MNKEVTWKDFLVSLALLILVFVVAVFLSTHQQKHKIIHRPDTINVDSLLNTNDSIKVVITYIDSVKNEQIQQVLSLDNDSTLELFKQLVRE